MRGDSLRIVGFLQVRNEVQSGHLERYLLWNSDLFDQIYSIDDSSSDGTAELLESRGAHVIRLSQSNFLQENSSKQLLLQTLLNHEPEGTAVFWMDADEVCYASRQELEDLIAKAFSQGYDSVSFPHLNLWRSQCHYRLDDQYNSLSPTRIWRLSKALSFETKTGLHQQTHPHGLQATYHSSHYPTFHYGFAETELILSKQAHYFLNWQRGYALDRLTNESTLSTAHVLEFPGDLGGRFLHQPSECYAPVAISSLDWRLMSIEARRQAEASQRVRVSIVCLIFQSTSWLEFAYGEALRLQRTFSKGEVEVLFVANDPTPEVVAFLEENLIPHVVFRGKIHADEWYINSVYRAYNHGVQNSRGEYVYLINSDMAFESNALKNAMANATPNRFTTSRLVERGFLASGEHAIEKDFGSKPSNFRRQDFLNFAGQISEKKSLPGGLFMPLLAPRERFLALGGFPPGNIRTKDLPDYLTGNTVDPATRGEELVSGDAAMFNKARLQGVEIFTQFNSIAYHFQEGELRDGSKDRAPSGLMISNDLIVGVNGEETLWGRVRKVFPTGRDDLTPSIEDYPRGPVWRELTAPVLLFARVWLAIRHGKPRLIFANATFTIPSPTRTRRIVLIQDRPKPLYLRLLQKLSVATAYVGVTNDLTYWQAHLRRGVRWAPIGFSLPETDFKTKSSSESLRGIFVGALNETKGANLLFDLIQSFPDVKWEIVSKIASDQLPDRVAKLGVRLHRKLSQNHLFELMEECDFLVCCSPHETQHLASLEAASLGIPVFTTPTGILGSGHLGHAEWGMSADPSDFISMFPGFLSSLSQYDPRRWVATLAKIQDSELELLLKEMLEETFIWDGAQDGLRVFFRRAVSFALNLGRRFMRYKVVPLARRIMRRAV